MIYSLSSAWGSFDALGNFLILGFLKATAPTVSSNSTKLYRKHVIGGNTAINFSGDLPNIKSIYVT